MSANTSTDNVKGTAMRSTAHSIINTERLIGGQVSLFND